MSRLTQAIRATRWYRRRLAGRMPQLLIIGAQKGGTSALFNYLAQHPQFAPSAEKELDYFGSDLRYSYGHRWYASQWTGEAANKIRFEASPQYLAMPCAAARIANTIPHAKLVVVLRDPALRAYSAWQMYRRQLAADPHHYRKFWRERYTTAEVARLVERTPAELENFELAIEREAAWLARGRSMEWSVLELGLYGLQLRRFAQRFPSQQLLALDNHDLRADRVATLDRVLQFLGLPAWNWSVGDLADVFVGHWTTPIPPSAREWLDEYYRESNSLLGELLPQPPRFTQRRAHSLSA